jgi:SP family sugar:H+ symporter-like MFS transporter
VRLGRIDEARGVLRKVLGNIDLDAKIGQIRETMKAHSAPSWSDLRGPFLGLLPIVWVGIGLSVFQQFVGINVIFYYSSVLWQAVGFNENDSLIITVVTSVVNIVTTLVAIASIDKFGRKPLLIIGSLGMMITLGVMALIFGTAPVNASGEPQLNGLAGPVALLAANLFVFSFGMSWGPVVWVLLGETFPNRIRAAALSLAAAAQWVANWVISTSFPALANAGLGLAYSIYAGCALLSLLFVIRFVRETKGQELETMTDEVRVVAH